MRKSGLMPLNLQKLLQSKELIGSISRRFTK